MAISENESFPLTSSNNMLTVQSVNPSYLGFAVPYFMDLGNHFSKPLEINELTLKHEKGYGTSGIYNTDTGDMEITSFSCISYRTQIAGHATITGNKILSHRIFAGDFDDPKKLLELSMEFPELKEEKIKEFQESALHELTHAYFNEHFLSKSEVKELEEKYEAMGTELENYRDKFNANINIKPKGRDFLSEKFEQQVREIAKDRNQYFISELEKNGLDHETYAKYTTLIALDENLARAHVYSKLGKMVDYDALAIVTYMMTEMSDISNGNEEIVRLSEEIKKNGLYTTMEQEYQKIMGKPSEKATA